MQKIYIVFFLLLNLLNNANAQDSSTKRLSFLLEGATGFNSNPSQEISPPQTSDHAGKSQGQNSLLSKTDFELQYSGKVHYKAIKTDSFTLHTNYDFTGESYAKNSEENYIQHNFLFPINFYTNSYRFELTPFYFYQTKNGTSYQSSVGLEGRVTSRFEDFDLAIFSSYIKTNALDSNDEDEAGELRTIGSELIFPSKNYELAFAISGQQSNNNDLPNNTTSYRAFSLNSSLSFLSSEWLHLLSAFYEQKNYTKDNSTNLLQKDELIILQYKPAYSFSKDFSIFLDFKYEKNTSNITEEEYTQYISLLGFTWFII